ncbi:hypothetical protein RCC89_19525 [Cytophagaceae bacterium ABcell3]|nr:hypothetical protein RCC89_19525 [Cytophagaceae bacterium ABcell3]
MKLEENFRMEFEKNLKGSKYTFKEQCMSFIKTNFETPNRILFAIFCAKKDPFTIDYNTTVKEIDYLFEDSNNFGLQLRNSFSYMQPSFFNNEIMFRDPDGLPTDVYYTPRYYDYVNKVRDLSYNCEDEFWKKADNCEWYEAISDFPCFLDIEISIYELEKYKEIGDIINVNDWLKYLRDLLKLFFSEFVFLEEFSTKKMVRFMKPLNGSVYFGFEYDEALLKRKYERGDLGFPEYFNLILINNDFKKATKKDEYIYRFHEDILSLGILGNPLFFNECIGLSRFAALDRTYERGNPQNNKLKYFREYVKVNDKKIQIVHPEGIGEKMKKHAFFYMDQLSTSSKSYLSFLEENILKSLPGWRT